MATLGRYELHDRLGRGGFATVYRAWDPALRREVALKALAVDLAEDQEMRRRFLAEAQALARLRHPNVVTVYDVGETPERPFFTMELIDGQTVADLLAGGRRLELAQVAAIVAGLASALDTLHTAGLVHRDVKAANIMVERSGRVVLMDLGIARDMEGPQFTSRSMVMLSPESASPEQVQGQQVGPAADIYSLGVVTYQMLAGRAPFVGETAQLLHAHVYEPPPALWDLVPGLPGPVYAAVQEALAKSPTRRPASAGAFSDVLTKAAGDAGITPTAPVIARRDPAPIQPQPQQSPPSQQETAYQPQPQHQPQPQQQPSYQQPQYQQQQQQLPQQPPYGFAPPSGPPYTVPGSAPPARRDPKLLIGGAAAVVVIGVLLFLLLRPKDDGKKVDAGTATASATATATTTTAPSPTTTATATATATRPPTATATATRPPTATVPPPPGSVAIIAADNFRSATNGAFPDKSTDPTHYTFAYKDGEYVIALVDPNYRRAPVVYLPGTNDDVSIAIDARVMGNADGRYVAIHCRRGTGDNSTGYRFTIDPAAGTYHIGRWDNGNETTLVQSTTSAAIKKGDAWNRLGLNCAGSTITASVNGTKVASVQDSAYKSGDTWVGTGIYSDSPPGVVETHLANLVATKATPGAPGPVLFTTPLTDAAKGLLGTDSSSPTKYRFDYNGGEYVIQSVDPTFDRLPIRTLPGEYADTTVAIDARVVGEFDGRYVSVACRTNDTGHYRLSVDPSDGSFRLARWDNGVETQLIKDTPLPAIKKGNERNHIELSCIGDTITADINGTRAGSVKDGTYRSGQIFIGGSRFTERTGTAEIHFAGITVTQK